MRARGSGGIVWGGPSWDRRGSLQTPTLGMSQGSSVWEGHGSALVRLTFWGVGVSVLRQHASLSHWALGAVTNPTKTENSRGNSAQAGEAPHVEGRGRGCPRALAMTCNRACGRPCTPWGIWAARRGCLCLCSAKAFGHRELFGMFSHYKTGTTRALRCKHVQVSNSPQTPEPAAAGDPWPAPPRSAAERRV